MRIEDLAWAAGFFDGEGFICIQRRGGKYKSHYLRLGINHVAPEPLYAFNELFGGIVRFDAGVKGNRKPRYTWGLSCISAETFLRQIQPYVKNKGCVLKLALDFQETMQKKGTAIPPELYDEREQLKMRIKALNAAD